MNFSFFKGTKVTVWGLGILGRGIGTTHFFAKHGARILVTDLKPRRELAHIIRKLPKVGIKFILGRHRICDMTNTDFVLKNPAALWNSRWARAARENGVPILTDVGLFLAGLPPGVKVIGVTGTKGKTTTCRLIYIMVRKKYRAHLVGVRSTSFLGVLGRIKSGDVVVAELSSFDLEGLQQVGKSPQVAVMTNISRDHMNRYPDFRSYVAVKENIFRFQNRGDVLVINGDDAILRNITRSSSAKVVRFQGRGSMANVNAAVLVARLLSVTENAIQKAVVEFRPLEGHIEVVGEKRNIIFINDTCATNPMAAKYAIQIIQKTFPERNIVMILGGQDKNLDFNALMPHIKSIYGAAVLKGNASYKILKVLRAAKLKNIVLAQSLRDAVRWSIESLRKGGLGGVILLSPAAASFGMFKNEFDRGAAFNRIVKGFVQNLEPQANKF